MTERTPAEEMAGSLSRFVPRLARNIAAAMEEEPSLQLSLRQLRILERVAERPHRTSELAAQSQVSQPTATAAVAALEARGAVRRRADPDDGRASLIELTDAGRDLLTECRERIRDRLLSIIGEVAKADAVAARRVERILVDGMERARARRNAPLDARRHNTEQP